MKKIILSIVIISISLFADLSSYENEYQRLLKQVEVGYEKNLFIIISANNCSFCEKEKIIIDSDISIQTGLANKYSNFFELNKDEIDLPEYLYVPVTPAIFILDKDEQVIYTEYGYKDASELQELIREFGINNTNTVELGK